MNIRKTQVIIISSFMLGISTGCIQETGTPGQERGNIKIEVASEKFSDAISTKTQIGDINEDGSIMIQWSAGDRIGVFGSSSLNQPFTSTNTSAAGEATFTGSMSEGDSPLYAYYPYVEGIADPKNIPVTIPSEQIYEDIGSIAQYDIKAAESMTEQTDGTYRLKLRQLVSLVRFEISLTGVDGLSLDEKLLRVELSTGANISGSYSYSLSDLDAGMKENLSVPENLPSPQLNLTFPEMPSLARNVIAYAIVVPGAQKDKEWSCRIYTDRKEVSFSTKALTDFEPGVFYTVPLNATVLENNDAVIDVIPETANCYIVNTTGEHSFLANVIGNGQKGIIPGAGFHTETAFISPKSARLIWQDVDGFIDPASVKLRSDNRCYYRAAKNTGNAVIAVYSGTDATGEILWSWHIWGIGDEPLSDDTYISSAGYGYTVMDRPLGAHSKLSGTCVLYQWGRKDPFSNRNTVYFNTGTPSDVAVWPSVSGTDSGTLEYSIANPDKFITFSKIVSNGDWLQTQNNSLWGNDMEIPWNWPDVYGHPDCRPGWASQKTIYDPSPAGYRVASPYVWTGIIKNKGDASTPGSSSTRLDQVNFIRYENDGWYFLLNPSDPEGVFYGTTGLRQGSDGAQENNGLYVYYFSSSPHRTRTMSTGLWCGKYVGPTNSSSSAHENAIKAMELLNRGSGCAIRCEKE